MDTNKTPIYPFEPWNVTEDHLDLAMNYRNETTFALSNGYIGTRGTHEEAYDFDEQHGLEGNFLNGLYEQEHVRYGEWNFGFPTESQTILNVPNCKTIRLVVDGEPMDIRTGTLQNYRRTLDMKHGQVVRSFEWTSPNGKTVRVENIRFVSLAHKNRMAQRYSVTPVNFSGTLTLHSALDADVENHTRTTNPLVDYGPFGRHLLPDALTADDKTMTCQSTAVNSKLAMACGSVHLLSEAAAATRHQANDVDAWIEYDFAAKQGHTITLEKLTVYTDSLDMDKDAMLPFVNEELTAFAADGYDKEFAAHAAMMEHFWETADIRVDGDVPLQQGLRFNLYHIMQASGRDGRTGMGAKGLSGEGYEGHYFWDTEMYVLPVFVYTQPELARSLLDYRYSTLDKARDRARVLGHPIGALYPWRTINGEEASTYFPLGTAQYHINADVAYAFQLYVAVTNDIDYLADKAAEVLCETARVWADVGCFAECRGGKYCICSVTGPDEYNAIVDNNFYTNLMAQQNLYAAVNALETLKEQRPDAYQKLIKKIHLDPDEPAQWKKTADAMYFAYDEKRQVYLQDDGFMLRKPWDDSRIPPEKRHLLYENYHPLFIYRQRMSKQADAIMGMMLYSALFTDEELLRNYAFYQTVTLHHSSLSTCIFGILASRIGRHEDAYTYFAQSARMDLDDYHDNFYAGIHAANMAGTWQSIVFGFAGLRLVNGVPEFKFYIPEAWNGYHFTVKIKESVLAVDVLPDGWTITLQSGDAVNFLVEGKPYELTEKGATCHEAL